MSELDVAHSAAPYLLSPGAFDGIRDKGLRNAPLRRAAHPGRAANRPWHRLQPPASGPAPAASRASVASRGVACIAPPRSVTSPRRPRGTVLEHFGSGTTDLHIVVPCREWVQSATVAAEAVNLELPAFASAINAGSAAALFPDDANGKALLKTVHESHGVAWGYDYEYDGCHPPPKKPETKCGSTWCVNTWWRVRTLRRR